MNSTAKVESARTPGSSGGIKRAVCLACGSEMISIETDGTRDELVAALQEIAKGEGEFSRNPLEHAENAIDSMRSIARTALAKVQL